MSKHTIEIFTAGCDLCKEAVRIVREAVAPCGCEVVERPADGPEAKARGVTCAPCIWCDGKQVICGLPTLEEAIEKLRVTA
ncbi:MAG: thioredoxin family protein [Armatimonadetes bacterium]|nr:thioredoxin family protein [Armatimonadota bacterium]